jgi:hypothetical protein
MHVTFFPKFPIYAIRITIITTITEHVYNGKKEKEKHNDECSTIINKTNPICYLDIIES